MKSDLDRDLWTSGSQCSVQKLILVMTRSYLPSKRRSLEAHNFYMLTRMPGYLDALQIHDEYVHEHQFASTSYCSILDSTLEFAALSTKPIPLFRLPEELPNSIRIVPTLCIHWLGRWLLGMLCRSESSRSSEEVCIGRCCELC